MTSIEAPPRIAANLRRDARGYYVPWFVHWDGDVPDFRVIATGKLGEAYKYQKCWVCGQPRGKIVSFVIGPMCAVNRTSAEPPSHRECAIYSARACPFLTRPKMRRNYKDIPEEALNPDGTTKVLGGVGLDRNPGVALVWITRDWHIERVFNGHIFKFGDPVETLWYCEGRTATRAEVMASIESGVPLLQGECMKEEPSQRGPAMAALYAMVSRAMEYVPI